MCHELVLNQGPSIPESNAFTMRPQTHLHCWCTAYFLGEAKCMKCAFFAVSPLRKFLKRFGTCKLWCSLLSNLFLVCDCLWNACSVAPDQTVVWTGWSKATLCQVFAYSTNTYICFAYELFGRNKLHHVVIFLLYDLLHLIYKCITHQIQLYALHILTVPMQKQQMCMQI